METSHKENYIVNYIVNNTLRKDPLIKHYREKKRNITIAFTKDLENGMIKYGAVICHITKPQDIWNKSLHVKTAIERFHKYPIVILNFPKLKHKSEYKTFFFYSLRSCLFKFGVKNVLNSGIYNFTEKGLFEKMSKPV